MIDQTQLLVTGASFFKKFKSTALIPSFFGGLIIALNSVYYDFVNNSTDLPNTLCVFFGTLFFGGAAILLFNLYLIIFAFFFILLTKKFLERKERFFIFWGIIGMLGGYFFKSGMNSFYPSLIKNEADVTIDTKAFVIAGLMSGLSSAYFLHSIYFKNFTKNVSSLDMSSLDI